MRGVVSRGAEALRQVELGGAIRRGLHGRSTLLIAIDYKGKWLILFSHPADFTPVFTTEFIGFAKAADTFKGLNCELLGLSNDSLFSHLAWTRNIQEKFGVRIPFPIIEDIKMEVAYVYGMVHPGAADTQAVRATFFIGDPHERPQDCRLQHLGALGRHPLGGRADADREHCYGPFAPLAEKQRQMADERKADLAASKAAAAATNPASAAAGK